MKTDRILRQIVMIKGDRSMTTRSGLQAFLCPTILAVDALVLGIPTCAGRLFPI
jgi:hypothetical protein